MTSSNSYYIRVWLRQLLYAEYQHEKVVKHSYHIEYSLARFVASYLRWFNIVDFLYTVLDILL